jgi:hypothetical protein
MIKENHKNNGNLKANKHGKIQWSLNMKKSKSYQIWTFPLHNKQRCFPMDL